MYTLWRWSSTTQHLRAVCDVRLPWQGLTAHHLEVCTVQ
jgi:hypothetical protein